MVYGITFFFGELDRIDGEPTEFEWKNFPGFTTLQILDEIQKMMTELKCEPEHFQGRIIFMSEKTAEGIMLNFAESGHPIFRASSALERGDLKSKGEGMKSIHFNGSDETIEFNSSND